ncbi:MAG: ABC transporter related protein [uncultured bacterium]|nr:MAG: ABC transporter related protein [uncultured bacterium]
MKRKIDEILSYLGPFRKKSFVVLAILLFSAIVDTLGVGIILPLMEVAMGGMNFHGKYTKYITCVFGGMGEQYLIHFFWITILIVMILRSFFLFLKRYMIFSFSADMKKYWSEMIMTNIIHYEFKEIIKIKKGDLVTNLRIAPNMAAKCLKEIIENIAKFILAGFTLIFMFLVNWQITGIALIAGLVLIAGQWRMSKSYSIDVGNRNLKQNQKIKSFVVETFNGIRQVKSFGMEDKIIKAFKERVNYLEDLMVKFNVIAFLPRVFGELVIGIAIVSFILGYVFVIKEPIAKMLPVIGVMMICFQRLYFNIGEILTQRFQILSGIPSLELVNQLATSKTFNEDVNKGKSVTRINNNVRLNNLIFNYEGKETLFNNLNLQFNKDHITSVVGTSGCGKTTVCDIVSSFYKDYNGNIIVDDTDLKNINVKSWRRMIGHVSQDTFLFNLSVKDNILCGNENASDEDVINASINAGAHEFINELPEKYDTLLGENGVGLSGGQRQRIAIARALVRKPEILIFDEATSALDSENERIILETIQKLRRGRIIIFVSHRIPVLTIADNIYVLDHGKLVETGSYKELLEQKGILWKLYNNSFESSGNDMLDL